MVKRLLLGFSFFVVLSINTLGQVPGKPNITAPANNASNVSQFPNLTWTGSADVFNVEISTDQTFGEVGEMDLGAYRYIAGPINITAEADNLSGVVYSNSTNTLFGVINNPPKILEMDLNGALLRSIDLIQFDDTEGITHIKGQTFAVVEEAKSRIVFFEISNGTTTIDFDADARAVEILPRTEDNSGLEAISYDPVSNMVWVLKEESPRQIIGFEYKESYSGIPTLTSPFDIETDSLGLIDLAGLQHMGAANSMDYRGANDHFLILSHRSKKLVEVDGNKNVYGEIELTKNKDSNLSENMVRPEGITIDRNGVIYVVEEATTTTPNRMFKFRNSALQADASPSAVYINFSTITCNSDDVPAAKLASNITYYWRVQGENSNGKGSWSSTRQFTTGSVGGLPNSAGLASPADNDTDQTLTPTFEWAGNATSYQIQISNQDCFENTVLDKGSLSGTTFTTPDGTLSPNTSYYWRIRGNNSVGPGAWSNSRRFRTNNVLAIDTQIKKEPFQLYPNPVKDQAFIKLQSEYSGIVQIRILDLLGKEKANKSLYKSAYQLEQSIDFNGFVRGIYLVEVKQGDKTNLLRILKQ